MLVSVYLYLRYQFLPKNPICYSDLCRLSLLPCLPVLLNKKIVQRLSNRKKGLLSVQTCNDYRFQSATPRVHHFQGSPLSGSTTPSVTTNTIPCTYHTLSI